MHATTGRVVAAHFAEERTFEDGVLIAAHPLLEGRRNRRRIDPAPRKAPPPRPPEPRTDIRRPLSLYDAVGRRLAADGATP